MQEESQSEGLRFTCPSCGSGLRYDIASGKLRCESCGRACSFSEIPDPSADDSDNRMEVTVYACPQCGAELHAAHNSAVSYCSFCGSDVVLTTRLARFQRPMGIVPFSITREKCEEIYREHIRKERFAPPELLRQETIRHFRPVYVPFWRYKGHAEGEKSSESSTSAILGDYQTTRRFTNSVTGSMDMEGMLFDASSAFDDETAMRLSFQCKDIKDFHAGYLCGCYAEAPDVGKDLFNGIVYDYCNRYYAYRYARTVHGSGFARMPNFKSSADLILMPVWLLANQQGGRLLYTAINGSTGEIVCDTPVSKKRFSLLAVLLAVLIFAVLLIAGSRLIMRPKLIPMISGVICTLGCWLIVPDMVKMLYRRDNDTDLTRQIIKKRIELKVRDIPLRNLKGEKIVEPANVWATIVVSLAVLAAMALVAWVPLYILLGVITVVILIIVGNYQSIRAYFDWNNAVNDNERRHGPLHPNTNLIKEHEKNNLWLRELVIFASAAAGFAIVARRIADNTNQFVAFMVSDTSFFPGFMLLVCMISLIRICRYVNASSADSWQFYVLIALMAAGMVLLMIRTLVFAPFFISLGMLAMLCITMFRQYQRHNEYATRPVPLFGKEAEKK